MRVQLSSPYFLCSDGARHKTVFTLTRIRIVGYRRRNETGAVTDSGYAPWPFNSIEIPREIMYRNVFRLFAPAAPRNTRTHNNVKGDNNQHLRLTIRWHVLAQLSRSYSARTYYTYRRSARAAAAGSGMINVYTTTRNIWVFFFSII